MWAVSLDCHPMEPWCKYMPRLPVHLTELHSSVYRDMMSIDASIRVYCGNGLSNTPLPVVLSLSALWWCVGGGRPASDIGPVELSLSVGW